MGPAWPLVLQHLRSPCVAPPPGLGGSGLLWLGWDKQAPECKRHVPEGRPSWLRVLLSSVTNEVVNLVPFEMGCGKGSHSRREAGSQQRCEEAGSSGQEAGPDSGEAAGMTPAPASLGPGLVGHFRLRPERNFKSRFFFLPQVRSDLKMKK